MTQMELDFTDREKRPHHRSTTLTVSGEDFRKFAEIPAGVSIPVDYCNDIVSTAACNDLNQHYMIRRTSLLRRQLNGGYRKVKIRTTSDLVLSCALDDIGDSADDACFGTAWIRKPTEQKSLS